MADSNAGTSAATTFTMPSDREIVMTRVFDAPRELVFKVMNDPAQLPHWWGPKRLTTTVETMDVRPGGRWRVVQRDPDGNEYAFNGVYREVVPPERVVRTFEFEGMPGHVLLETATFEEHDGKTKFTSTALFESVEDRDGMLESGSEAGATESMDRFAELLKEIQRDGAMAEGSTADREITLTRVFDAPRELVFAAWTEPKHVAQWWGPNGFTNTIHEMDVRPGGVWRLVMHGPDGTDYPNKIVYSEVVKPERLVYTHGSGEEADPGQFRVTVTFADRGGKTVLTMRSLFESAAARDKVVKEFHAIEGGNQTLDRLGAYLAKM